MKLKLLLALLFFPAVVFAQIQSQEGKLILADGKALAGSVTYFYDKPAELYFFAESGAKHVYAPHQLQEIQLNNGEKFVSRNYKTNGDSASLLLKVLLESPKISLFSREENATEYFYVSKDDRLYRLENNEVYAQEGHKQYVRKDNKYIGTLSALMSDRMDLLENVRKAILQQKSLTKLIKEYNQGEETYEWKSGSKANREPNWVFFTQYSRYGFSKNFPVEARGYGNMAGFQYYFSKHSRHSFKASIDHSSFRFGEEGAQTFGLGLRYEMAFKKAEKFSAYMLVHMMDIAYVSYTHPEEGFNENGFLPALRLSPGLGLEAKPLPRVAVYAEINNLFIIEELPKSISLGLKYDFGKTNWK